MTAKEDLVFAGFEMLRRADALVTSGRDRVDDATPIIEVRIDQTDLADPTVRAGAEKIAKLGRKVNVHLTLTGRCETRWGFPPREWFGGSDLLREAAYRSQHVNVDATL